MSSSPATPMGTIRSSGCWGSCWFKLVSVSRPGGAGIVVPPPGSHEAGNPAREVQGNPGSALDEALEPALAEEHLPPVPHGLRALRIDHPDRRVDELEP